MTPSSRDVDALLTVVVVDNAATSDAVRVMQQLVKTSPHTTDLVLASMRSPRLPASLARRVRKLKAVTADLLDAAVLAEATRPHLTVVTSAAASFRHGWRAEVNARVDIYKDVVTSIDSASGGALIYPSGVVSAERPTVPWLTSETIIARTSGQRSGAAPTISAVMIVKNEEDVLDACLTAVTSFVDEVIVYDTGSTDATMDIARAHGVVVIEGYWDDHFGNARNRALAHATGDWIFHVDADEVVTGDANELGARLAVEPAEQLHVAIVSTSWKGVQTGLETMPIRLFRRGTSEWVGALHEFPKPPDGSMPSISPIPAPVRILHSGYEMGKVIDRNKTARNVDLAQRDLELAAADSPMRAELLSNLVRSLMWAGRVEEALPVFDELRVTPGNITAICMSGRPAVPVMLNVGRLDEADRWIETLAESGESAGNLAVLRARRLLFVRDFDGALREIEPYRAGANGGVDPWSVPFDRAELDLLVAEIDLARGDTAAAVDGFMTLLARSSALLNLNTLLLAMMEIGRPLTDLAADAPEELIARSVREASAFHPSGALAWFEALHQTYPGDHRPVVAGNMFADRDGWQTALTWSARAREAGLDDVCALRGLGARETAPLLDRCLAWALLAEIFGEVDAEAPFALLSSELSPAETEQLVTTLADLGIEVTVNDTITVPHEQVSASI